jgi:LytTr DNA-binding domain
MTRSNIVEQNRALRLLPNWVREHGYGFLYWLAFLLVLEPDNAVHALRSGHELAFDHEALRITAAAFLGAAVTPLVLILTRRFPVLGPGLRGPGWWRRAQIHLVGVVGLAFGLIVASCFLAAWGFEGKWLPSVAEIHGQIVSNGLLLVYAVSALSALAHGVYFFHPIADSQTSDTQATKLTRIRVKTRGRLSFLNIEEVDWIETEGNYLALHVGSAVHMIRETSTRFEAKLDPSRFVRIHRRIIVAIDRIRDLRAVANGDAIVRLLDGRELRASRRFRRVIRERWSGHP